MKYINPSAIYWKQGSDRAAHVARCARVCYASDKTTDNEKMVARLEANGHTSMFRHESRYYIVHDSTKAVPAWTLRYLQASGFAACYIRKKKEAYISTNGQYVREREDFFQKFFARHEVTADAFIAAAVQSKNHGVMMLIRHTVCLDTQISTSRELNRKSPNCIAEQSTRYVNFGKRGGITICRPWWLEPKRFYENNPLMSRAKPRHLWLGSLLMRMGWHIDDILYRLLVKIGFPPQEARAKLPLATATRVIYTYNGFEWKHIFDLRLRETTGKAHPDAIRAAQLMYKQIKSALMTMGIDDLDI